MKRKFSEKKIQFKGFWVGFFLQIVSFPRTCVAYLELHSHQILYTSSKCWFQHLLLSVFPLSIQMAPWFSCR